MASWDFKHHHVQQFDNTETSSQLGSKAVLISVGPTTFDQHANAVVMGFVQNLSVQQQRQIIELFEIGSERRVYVNNPHRNALQLSRALISGPSLLKVIGSGILNRGIAPGDQVSGKVHEDIFTPGDINAVAANADNNFWINLASDLFNNPMGIMLQFREFHGDGRSTSYGAVYLQNCMVQAHGLGIVAQTWLMQEDMSLLFEHAVPLDAGSKVHDAYKKRLEIMNETQNMDLDWSGNYSQWMGTPAVARA